MKKKVYKSRTNQRALLIGCAVGSRRRGRRDATAWT
jgi:hypothetical protein